MAQARPCQGAFALQDGYGSYPSNDYGSDLYVPDDADVIILEEHHVYEDDAVEVLHVEDDPGHPA